MKNRFLTILLSFVFIQAFPQELIVSETFDRASYNWESTGSDTGPSYKDGNMIMRGHSYEDLMIVSSAVVIDPSLDYSIGCSLKYEKGYSGNAFGMVLCDLRYSPRPVFYFLMLYPGDGYEVSYSNTTDRNLRWYEILPRIKDKNIIKPAGEYDHLTLINKNGVLTWSVNDKNAWVKQDPDICISAIGFFTMGYRETYVDELIIRQDGWNDINLADESMKNYQKENLGPNVNSHATELLPIISADGKTLFLCVQGDPANTGHERDQDIWFSTLNPDNTWSKRINIGAPLNNSSPNFVSYISPDNNTLLVGNRYDKTGNLAGDGFSISNRTAGGWTVPTALVIDNYYNNNRFVGCTYSPSGKTLILSIERNDTYGCKDLYVCFRKTDGTWTTPKNMGPDINTFSDEISPFLAADDATLYFASDAWPGYGSHDIFLSRRIDDTWTHWSRPENLGPNINSSEWEAYFTIPASGEYSYLVASEDYHDHGDIYRVKVAETAKPKPVALVQGKVFDQKTLLPLESDITYYDLETNAEIGTARSNPSDGSYKISLPAGRKYSFFAQRHGYFPISENIDLTSTDQYTELTKDLYLAPIEEGQTIRLNNIFFDFDKTDLLPESVFELDRLVRLMQDNPTMVIRIEGHTDNLGSDAYNLKLSEDRARAANDYLESKGLGDRVSAKGYGESKPVTTNDTDEGRAMNRRVEFVIVKK